MFEVDLSRVQHFHITASILSVIFTLQLEDQDSGELENLVNNTQHGSQLLKLLQPASQAEKQVHATL